MSKLILPLLLLSSATILAQKTDSLKTRTIEDIKLHKTGNPNNARVSTTKSQLDVMETPQAIAVVTHETIEQQQAQQLSDVVKNVNGVYLTSSRGSSQDSFGARGYTFGNENIFKNGNRINSGIFPEVSGLERVEVLKGSAAILYGNIAPGGIVNMITKKPLFNFGGNMALNYGSWNNVKPTIDLHTGISKSAAIRVNGSYENKESFRDFVQSEKHYFNPSFLLNISDKTQLIVEIDYLKHHFTPDYGLGSYVDRKTEIAQLNTSLPINTFIGATWQYNKTKMLTNTVTINHNFNNNWSSNIILNYQNYHRDFFSTERVRWFYNNEGALPENSFRHQITKSYNKIDYGAAQWNLNGTFSTGKISHKILIGADADYQKNTQDFYYDLASGKKLNAWDSNYIAILNKPETWNAIPELNTALNDRTITPNQRIGTYIQDLLSLGKFKILLGARYNYIETKNSELKDFKTNTTQINSRQRLIERAITPKAALIYQFTDNAMSFASYTQSFMPNNTGTNLSIDGTPLKASMIDQYEIGIKQNIIKNTVAINLTAYQIDNDNIVITSPTNINFKENAGKSRSQGIELDITGNPNSHLSLIGGVSYNKTVFSETNPTTGFLEGERMTRTPSVTANASLFYTLPKYVKGLKLGISAFHTGERLAGWNNQKDQKQIDRTIKMGGFTTLDLSIGYDYKKISILGKIGNLLNTLDYNVHESYSVNPITPRNFYLTFNYKL